MKKQVILYLFTLLLLSCSDRGNQSENSAKAEQKNAEVFKTISEKWVFNFPNSNPQIQNALKNWNDWDQFKKELEQKPKTSLRAFQLKIENVAQKSDSLSLSVPEQFNNPQVRSRLVTLSTKINSLTLICILITFLKRRFFHL